jgi:hypothetical protein
MSVGIRDVPVSLRLAAVAAYIGVLLELIAGMSALSSSWFHVEIRTTTRVGRSNPSGQLPNLSSLYSYLDHANLWLPILGVAILQCAAVAVWRWSRSVGSNTVARFSIVAALACCAFLNVVAVTLMLTPPGDGSLVGIQGTQAQVLNVGVGGAAFFTLGCLLLALLLTALGSKRWPTTRRPLPINTPRVSPNP